MTNLVIFMLSAWFGVSLFFSFDVAPMLFDTLPGILASAVVSHIFPIYFGIGLFILILSMVLMFKDRINLRKIYPLLAYNIIVCLSFLIYILPEADILKHTNYQGFMRLHAISMILNLSQMIFTFVAIVRLL